jgi:hypothetical protein
MTYSTKSLAASMNKSAFDIGALIITVTCSLYHAQSCVMHLVDKMSADYLFSYYNLLQGNDVQANFKKFLRAHFTHMHMRDKLDGKTIAVASHIAPHDNGGRSTNTPSSEESISTSSYLHFLLTNRTLAARYLYGSHIIAVFKNFFGLWFETTPHLKKNYVIFFNIDVS